MYHKPVALPIKWEGWLHKFIQKIDLEDKVSQEIDD